MKKRFLITLAAFGALCLTACDFFNFGKKDQDGDGGQQEPAKEVDRTIYGTGAADETLTVGAHIPAGEYVAVFKAPENQPEGDPVLGGFVGVYNRSVSAQNMRWEDDFQTTSMCQIKDGDVVNLKYATLQNIEANPQIGALKNGLFKIGVHIKTNNGVLTVKANGRAGSFSSTAGQAIFFEKLSIQILCLSFN